MPKAPFYITKNIRQKFIEKKLLLKHPVAYTFSIQIACSNVFKIKQNYECLLENFKSTNLFNGLIKGNNTATDITL